MQNYPIRIYAVLALLGAMLAGAALGAQTPARAAKPLGPVTIAKQGYFFVAGK